MTKAVREDQIVAEVCNAFTTFGGGRKSEWNPISAWMQDKPPMFAMGVDVRDVVSFVLSYAPNQPRRRDAVRRSRKSR